MKVHSIKTDNTCVYDKVYLRKIATNGIDNLRVLDLFAGENVLWSHFITEKYFGVEKVKGKGKNLNADNERVIASLDLSQFNVIDVDSYGIPFNQICEIFKNPSLKNGTVIIYTCITNKMSGLNRQCVEMFGIEKMYKKNKVLFNGLARELFYAMLQKYGVKEVFYYRIEKNFSKDYGYFIVDKYK